MPSDPGWPRGAARPFAAQRLRRSRAVDSKGWDRHHLLSFLQDRFGPKYPPGGVLPTDYDPQQAAYSDAVAHICNKRRDLQTEWQKFLGPFVSEALTQRNSETLKF